MLNTIGYIYFLFTLIVAQGINTYHDWAINVFNEPKSVFSDNYEKQIFQKFCSKFKQIEVQNIEAENNIRLLSLKLVRMTEPYYLELELDNLQQVKRVFRRIPLLDSLNFNSGYDNITKKWLGRLFYFIDSGDSVSLADILFFQRIKVMYKNQTNKSLIIPDLLQDFPHVIHPSQISVHEKYGKLFFEVNTLTLSSIFLEIPVELVSLDEIDILQENFFIRLNSFFHSSDEAKLKKNKISQMNDSSLLQALDCYPGVVWHKDTLTIPYHINKVTAINNLRFLSSSPKIEKKHFFPLVTLAHDSSNNVLVFNHALPIAFSSFEKLDNITINVIQKAIENIYRMIPPFHSTVESNSVQLLTGSFRYRGYKIRMIKLPNTEKWQRLWEFILQEGPIYFYPSQIENFREKLVVKGILYSINLNEIGFYHFMELKVSFYKNEELVLNEMECVFYPYQRKINF